MSLEFKVKESHEVGGIRTPFLTVATFRYEMEAIVYTNGLAKSLRHNYTKVKVMQGRKGVYFDGYRY